MSGPSSELVVSKGKIIIDEKNTERSMFIIKSGAVEIFKTKGSEKIQLATLGPGEYFGEMSFFDDAPRSASVAAIEDSKVIKIVFNEEMKKQLDSVPKWIQTILKGVLTRLRHTNERVRRLEEATKINYKEMKGEYLTSHQLKELWRSLTLVEYALVKHETSDDKTPLTAAIISDAVMDFIPQLSIGFDNIMKFLDVAGILKLQKDKGEYEIVSLPILSSFNNFIKTTLRTNEGKLQVTPQEMKVLEVISSSTSGEDNNIDHAIHEEQIVVMMQEKFNDPTTGTHLKKLAEKLIINRKVDPSGKATVIYSPEDLKESLPYMRIFQQFTEIFVKAA